MSYEPEAAGLELLIAMASSWLTAQSAKPSPQ